MDRRTIIFLLLLSFSFIAINNFLFKKEPQTTQIVVDEGGSEISSSVRSLSPSQLPLATLYRDSALSEVATQAAAFNGTYVTLPYGDSLAQELYTAKGEKLALLISGKQGAPIVYTALLHPSIPSTYLPQIGAAPIQCVNFSGGETFVYGASYSDGTLAFTGEKPKSNALALYSLQGEWVLIGLFDVKQNDLVEIAHKESLQELISYKSPPLKALGSQEEFYVLENDYLQIVFSNIGGAIAEINLPFASKENTSSVVRPIEFDRALAEQAPSQDTFPNFSAARVNENGVREQVEPKVGGYYPLLRRTIKGSEAGNSSFVPPRFYAFNVLSDDPDLALTRFSVKSFTATSIEFEASLRGQRITKRFELAQEKVDVPYTVKATIKVDGDNRGLWIGSGVPEVELISNNYTPALKYRATTGAKSQVEKLALPKKESATYNHIQPDWISNSNGFFSLILDPINQKTSGLKSEIIPGAVDPTRLSLIDPSHDLYPASKYPGYNILLPLKATSQPQTFRLYAGPLERDILKQVDQLYFDPVTGYDPDYKAAISFHGWFAFISEPFAKFLFMLMSLFYSFTNSWGFSIILLTVALRLMLYPLNAWSIKSNLRMKDVAPKVSAIQQKYKKDPTKVQLETMQLYKEMGVNPFSGCLPLLIQMPFLIGMFDLLKSSFELRGASFVPGWIDNLTAPDVLFSWNMPIIFIGTEFHLLPILLGATMFLQQKWMQGKNTQMQTDQQKQTQTMGNVMTLVFTFMFYRFPSGLNLYWISSMLLSIAQQAYMTKRYEGKLEIKPKVKKKR